MKKILIESKFHATKVTILLPTEGDKALISEAKRKQIFKALCPDDCKCGDVSRATLTDSTGKEYLPEYTP